MVASGNATDAYRKVYGCGGSKPATINRKAKAMMDKDKIAARIAQIMKPLENKLFATAEKTITRLMQGQEFDIRKLYHEDGSLKKPHELDDNTAKGIVGVKYDRDGNILEYKTIDVKGCAELVGKYLKLFTDKVEHSGNVNYCVVTGIDKAPNE